MRGKNHAVGVEPNGGEQFFGARHSDGGLAGIVAIVGQSGTGKTYRTLAHLRRCKRVIFNDTVGNIGTGPRQNPCPPGFVELWGLPALIAFMQKHRRGNFRVIFHPGRGLIAQGKKQISRSSFDFDALCRLAWEIRDVVIAVDEVWKYCSAGWMPAPLDDLVFTGRHAGVTLLYTAQMPQMCAVGLRSQTTRFSLFRLQQKQSIDSLRCNERITDAICERLPSLPDRARIEIDERGAWKYLRG